MTTIITIFAQQSLRGRLFIKVATPGQRIFTAECKEDNSAAVAIAMSHAVECSSYAIFGPKEILDLIPQNLRSK